MPSVSRQQQKAMFAAASGNSNIGIPKKVGEDFANADIARGPDKLPAKVHEGKPMHMAKGGVVPDKSKVSDKWGVDLTKWANESDADKLDDQVRNEGNLQAKAALEAKREALVDAGNSPAPQPAGMHKGGKVPGKGSGDHVAALLEPGELVIPKKDVEGMFKPRNTWTEDTDDDGE